MCPKHAEVAMTVGGEFPQGGAEWLIEESSKKNSKKDLDEDMRDVSSQESHC